MGIYEQLDKALAKSPQDQSVQVQTKHGCATLDVVATDSLSCELSAIQFAPAAVDAAPGQDWDVVADEIASKVRYLSEPLAVIERDQEAQQAQVRSAPPKREDRRVTYFECLATPKRISLRRFRKSPSTERETLPFSLTRDSLTQLLRDFDNALEPTLRERKSLRQRFHSP